MLKFKHLRIYKKKKEERIPLSEEVPTSEDLEAGKRYLIRQSQFEFFEDEIKLMSVNLRPLNINGKGMKTKIAQFNPFLDEYGIMRSKSRL